LPALRTARVLPWAGSPTSEREHNIVGTHSSN
jgi:hypothetical protein